MTMTDRGTLSRFASDLLPPPELGARIRAAIAATPAPKLSTRRRVAIAAALAPCASVAVLLIATQWIFERSALRPGLRLDAAAAWAPSAPLLLVLSLLVGLTLAATVIALGRGARGLGPGAATLAAAACLVAPIYGALALGGASHAVEPAARQALSPVGAPCLYIGSAVGLLVLGAFATALRRAAPAASRLRGAALGAAAGAWAGLTVFVFCPAGAHRHLLVGHVLPIAALTLVGLIAIPRALRP
jgi:hypothetical protein